MANRLSVSSKRSTHINRSSDVDVLATTSTTRCDGTVRRTRLSRPPHAMITTNQADG